MKWRGVVNLAALKLSVLLTPCLAFAYDDSKFGLVCNTSMTYTEGGFGALLTAAAGIGSIVAAATGNFRTFWALLVVSAGSFIVRNYLELWFQGCG
jgi:hypothetical protein